MPEPKSKPKPKPKPKPNPNPMPMPNPKPSPTPILPGRRRRPPRRAHGARRLPRDLPRDLPGCEPSQGAPPARLRHAGECALPTALPISEPCRRARARTGRLHRGRAPRGCARDTPTHRAHHDARRRGARPGIRSPTSTPPYTRPPGHEGAAGAACEARLGRLPLATHLLSIVLVLLLPHYYYWEALHV